MLPSRPTLRAWPVTRMVPRKALATLSWRRSTLPMMALVLGALKAAMPRPTTARAPTTSTMPAPRPIRARSTIPAATITMPAVARARDPIRSLIRPATGLRPACMSGWASMIQPVMRAGWPGDQLQLDRGEHADGVEGAVVEQGGQVGRGEQAVAPEQVQVHQGRRRPGFHPRKAASASGARASSTQIAGARQPHSVEKVRGTMRQTSRAPSRAAPGRSRGRRLPGRGRVRGRSRAPAPGEGGGPHRQVHQEDPGPAQVVHQQPAQGRAHAQAQVDRHDVDPHRPAPLLGRERRR